MTDVPLPDFSLIETMRWEPGTGIVRLRLHLARLTRSAGRLGFAGADRAAERLARLHPSVLSDISPLVGEMSAKAKEGGGSGRLSQLRVRLTLDSAGEIAVTTTPFLPLPENTIWRIAVASTRLDSANKLLRHKTTRRDVYEKARSEYPAALADEVLLLNEKGEPCEGTITSVFVDDGSGILKTPPISNGLLAGVLRTELICQRRARVERLTVDDLRAGKLYMGNSLRGLIQAELMEEDEHVCS